MDILEFKGLSQDVVYERLSAMHCESLSVDESIHFSSYHYFDESQMIYSNSGNNKFLTDNVNECMVTILYNSLGELFAVHSNPASIPEFDKIINDNFMDKTGLKSVFVGGSKENEFISRKNVACCVNSLVQSGYEIEVKGAAINKGYKSVMVGFDEEMKLSLSKQEVSQRGEDFIFNHSCTMLVNSCCFHDKEKYGWKPENNIAFWSYRSANDLGEKITQPEIPSEFLKKLEEGYNSLNQEQKNSLRGDKDELLRNRGVINRLHNFITGIDVRNIKEGRLSHDEEITIDAFRGFELRRESKEKNDDIKILDVTDSNNRKRKWIDRVVKRRVEAEKDSELNI